MEPKEIIVTSRAYYIIIIIKASVWNRLYAEVKGDWTVLSFRYCYNQILLGNYILTRKWVPTTMIILLNSTEKL